MTWVDYIENVAAPHSAGNAGHWFRYLRKIVDKDISKTEIDALYNSEALTPFQRVSIKNAFVDDSPTRAHIVSLNVKPVKVGGLICNQQLISSLCLND